MVMERLDNEIAETDDDGRPVLFGQVAARNAAHLAQLFRAAPYPAP